MNNSVIIGNATLYLGDCRETLPALPKVDAVITDPPYGIVYSKGTSNLARGKAIYTDAFDDSPKYVTEIVIPSLKYALSLANGRGVITPGTPNLFLYPAPSVLGGFYQPATVGLNKWGRANYNPVCFYGKDPRAGKTIQPTMIQVTEPASSLGHPCAKPLKATEWMVARGSMDNETVLDIFMGSGTTGVACMNLGRKFIGIEIEPKYFDIACCRIEDAQRQQRLIP